MEKESKTEMDLIAEERYTFVIVGGGIAGVTCAETTAICCPEQPILLLTESNIIKTVANLEPVARYLYKFDVQERTLAGTCEESSKRLFYPTVTTQVGTLQHVDATDKYIITSRGKKIFYEYLCICTGGRPRLIEANNPLVLGIRDTDSVLELQKRLEKSKSVVLVGNGGIASELAYELKGVEVHWVVRDNHIASTFIDPGAAFFFQQAMDKKQEQTSSTQSPENARGIIKRLRFNEITASTIDSKKGAALGPDWHKNFELKGSCCSENTPKIHFKSVIKSMCDIFDETQNKKLMKVELSTGEVLFCDFVVSATGVDPRLDYSCKPPLNIDATDNGISVNEMMQTSNEYVFAAGDVCTASWDKADHWFQMRLWTQARQMGSMAGRSMAAHFLNETIYQDFCFELFGHVTQLFGLSVILLGRYNGQGLGTNYEILLRTTPGQEYIKFILKDGKLRGAILIGNTELAETCENLILNGIDLTPFGDDILNPDIDIDDYFD
ncbi:pyridine nucleotide-disulfide oxidoreductase domain-containing protein 1 [Stomoxys calcitrans]|uniref:pyridine nucleotide-disulfide oxidoreductase domain-containing protein 1 n=1 Tax=Stomoxys calcitrans TaxID=35570 RepID=UPI0027E332B6|nr:pyridine nucleotide-disulfide oxidoreductase domain-containing protein 1 [Stomoxys calcitrans]